MDARPLTRLTVCLAVYPATNQFNKNTATPEQSSNWILLEIITRAEPSRRRNTNFVIRRERPRGRAQL